MNLIVDIGNSSVKAAIFNGEQIVLRKYLENDVTSHLAELSTDFEIGACAYSSVGQPNRELIGYLHQLFPHILEVTGTTPTPLICDYLTPQTLGADRLAAAVGANECCLGHALMIIDVGTCITYDFVSADHHYLGGNISLGLGMRLRALHEQTALLPLVSANGELLTYGQNTETAIRAGVINGIENEIEGYVRKFNREYPDNRIFITGGNSFRFLQDYEIIRNDALVEIGLNKILNYNILR